ncbi:PEX5-related protein isoform X11 [Kogia breviceps]|uniref:PEX5-related protein isoform X11 n=1 Tax=Kogia breviceps TaxID=27615 RepID=UPI0034D21926
MSDSEMDGKTHIPSLLNVLLSRSRVMHMSYLKSKEKGYGKLSSDEDLKIIVDQKQGKGSRAADKAVAMVMKEIPREESAEEKPLLTMTSQLVNEQQESRPLLSPSIDDFLCETKSEAIARPVTSNTAVLTTGLDLLDLSEPVSQTQTKAKKLEASSKTSSLKKKADGPDLISADPEQRGQALRNSETASLDLDIQTQLEKWDDVKFHGDRNSKGHPMAERKSSSSRTGSKELLWSSEHRSQPELSGGKSALNSETAAELELVPPTQARLTKEQRWGSTLLSRNHSLEEEFERAKAAVESDTEFWDKMQAEWEEMARRNWISENQEAQNQVTISASEKAWQFLGITQAENENEQAAIVALQRCLELQPNNLKALMALAVSYTNTGHQQDACEALKNWIKQNPKYKYLVKSKKGSPGLTRRMSKSPVDSSVLEGVKELYLEAAHQNGDMIDPDLQTGLGVLFHLSGEFNRAIDAFNAALTVRPEDYSLWNRLGATLANGDRSEEAVEAYTRALEIQPGFIRSRYNLGISCINLGAYREAVSNFLTALSLQRKSRNQQQVPHPAISGNIWAALRIALSLMDQPELFQAANLGDLDVLLRAFNLDP